MSRPKRPLPTSLEELTDVERRVFDYGNEGLKYKEIEELEKGKSNISDTKVYEILHRLQEAGLYTCKSKGRFRKGMVTHKSQRILDVMQELIEEFYPRTLRSYYYQLVVRGLFPNVQTSYDNLSQLLVRSRRNGTIPYDVFSDSSRPRYITYFDTDLQDYVDTFRDYKSDWWKNQDRRIVLWLEKDALMNVVEPIAQRYHVDLYCGKGDTSLTVTYEAAKRINDIGQDTTILYLGDFDPKGMEMEGSLYNTLQEDHDCSFEHDRIAVAYDQAKEIEALGLSNVVKDAKAKGNSAAQLRGAKIYNNLAAAHRAKYGNLSVELDAYTPMQLQALVEAAIVARCDMGLLVERQKADRVVNARIKKALQPLTEECGDYE